DQRHGRAAPPRGAAGLAGGRGRDDAVAGGGTAAAALGRLHPRGLAGLLLVVRRPGRVAEAGGLVLVGEGEEALQRARGPVDALPRVALLGDAARDGVDGERGGVAARHLVPAQGGGHARVGGGPHRVGGRDGAVLGVLVVVEEHPLALLLPP